MVMASSMRSLAGGQCCSSRGAASTSSPCAWAGSRPGRRAITWAAPHLHRHHPRRSVAASSAKASELLLEARRKYEAGDRMTAMKLYEQTLEEADLEASQRQAALYGTLAVHASFGDVELAQMSLRDAVQAGLDFEQAQKDPSYLEINSSPQILIQLGRFNKQVLRGLTDRSDERAALNAAAGAARRRSGASSSKVTAEMDLNALLGPMDKSKDAIDASPKAIAGRVALVLLAGIILGVGLFYLGLEYMFPKLD